MSLSIRQVVDAQIMPQAQAALRRNFGMIAIFTKETGKALSADKRYVIVSSDQEAANLFGTDSNTYKAVQALFSVRPRPKQAMIAFWNKEELPSKALHLLQNSYQDWYGAYFADLLSDEQLDDFHTWIAAADMKVAAYTAIRDELLEFDDKNIFKKLFDKNSGRLMVQYNKTGDNHAALSLLGMALSTNWNAQNTAQTLKFKQQTNVRSDARITIDEAKKCQRLGVNFYTDYDGMSMLAEGTMLGGKFIDEIVGLDAFIDACQKQAFSTLHANPTKIPQTDKGQAMLLGSLVIIGNEFVRNGFLAGGVWRGNDIGELIHGGRLDEGFYFYSDSYDLQSIADREARKAMPIMCAIKLAGAIHSVDLLIQFNR